MTLLDTSTVIVDGEAHWPASGVNVYMVEPTVDVFITAGDQKPVIGGELLELAGNMSGVALRQ